MPQRPTTDSQKRNAGTYRPSTSRAAPEVNRGMPPMPRGLSKQARAVWKRIVPQLARRGVLSVLDGDGLVVLCVLRAEFETDPAAFTPSKLAQLRLLLAEYGLTPASRARVPVLDDSKPEQSATRSAGGGKVVSIGALLAKTTEQGR